MPGVGGLGEGGPCRRILGYDEDFARQVLTWTEERLRRDPSPFTGARPRDELEAAAGATVTEDGLGFDEAFRVFTDVLVPATRAQDHPLNLAYIPNAPTEAARLMDVVVSVSSIFGGVWEAGAAAIFAENQALDWLRQLAGFPESAGGCFVSGATVGTLSAVAAAGPQPVPVRLVAGAWPPPARPTPRSVPTRGCWTSGSSRCLPTSTAVSRARRWPPPWKARMGCSPPSRRRAPRMPGSSTTWPAWPTSVASAASGCTWTGRTAGPRWPRSSARDRLAGIERADSLVIDPHKWLFANYDCAALLYRDPDQGPSVHAQHADYLDTVDRQVWNPTGTTPCTSPGGCGACPSGSPSPCTAPPPTETRSRPA